MNHRERFGFLERLEAHADVFRNEALALEEESFYCMPEAANYSGGSWSAYLLQLEQFQQDFPLVSLEKNRGRCPKTWAVVSALPGLVIAGFMRLAPNAEIRPHRAKRDDDVIRAHVGLQLPADEQLYWPEGSARLMDIRALHAAQNRSDRPRLTLCVDVRMPFVIHDGEIPAWGPPQ